MNSNNTIAATLCSLGTFFLRNISINVPHKGDDDDNDNDNNNNNVEKIQVFWAVNTRRLVNFSDVSKDLLPSSLRSKSASSIMDYLVVKIKELCWTATSIGRSVSEDGKLHQPLFQKSDFKSLNITHTNHKGTHFLNDLLIQSF